jgi:hypothetical protein
MFTGGPRLSCASNQEVPQMLIKLGNVYVKLKTIYFIRLIPTQRPYKLSKMLKLIIKRVQFGGMECSGEIVLARRIRHNVLIVDEIGVCSGYVFMPCQT